MDTQRIVSELKVERNRLDKAITALDGANTTRALAKRAISFYGAQPPRKRHHLTAAGRKQIYVDEEAVGGEKKEAFLSFNWVGVLERIASQNIEPM